MCSVKPVYYKVCVLLNPYIIKIVWDNHDGIILRLLCYIHNTEPKFSYKLWYIVGFWLVEMAISTNQKPAIYRNLYENTDPELQGDVTVIIISSPLFIIKPSLNSVIWPQRPIMW